MLLFGSLAHLLWFREDSNVDLAVQGLKGAEDYWEAWQAIDEIIDNQFCFCCSVGVGPS